MVASLACSSSPSWESSLSLSFLLFPQVKTRMQLEHGKTSTSLFGSFRSIIREDGCVHYDSRLSLRQPNSEPFAIVASDVSTAVGGDLKSGRMVMNQPFVKRSRSSTASRSTETCHQIVRLFTIYLSSPSSHVMSLCQLSAANDFWAGARRSEPCPARPK